MKRNVKVLNFSVTDAGGAGKACLRLHKGLSKEDSVDSKLLVLQKQSSQEELECYEFYSSKLHYYLRTIIMSIFSKISRGLKFRKNKHSKFSSPISLHRLHNHDLFEWADIINLHWVGSSLDYRSFFKNVGKPVVWTLHDMHPFSGGNHYDFGFPKESFSKLIRKNLKLKTKAVENKDLTIVTLCKWMLNLSSTSSTFQKLPHVLIPNSIDTTIYKYNESLTLREELNIDLDKKIILFVANSLSEERKGFSMLEDTFNQLNDCIFLIVGDHIPNITNDNLIFLGKIYDEEEMARIYGASDLYIIPSLEDNLPNTVLESLCCGIPVVGFRIGGIPDMVEDGVNGYLSNEILPEAFLKSIKKSLKVDFDKSKISKEAIKKYKTNKQIDDYLSLYKGILKNKNKFLN
jgi:glycosyltransferase involved in cell wall biosynthesis